MENYIILEMIGEGAFGKVYKGQRKCTNQIVAIKKIIKKGKKEKELKNFLIEKTMIYQEEKTTIIITIIIIIEIEEVLRIEITSLGNMKNYF